MSPLRYFFDPSKSRSNLKKHGVSFEEAETIFVDPLASTLNDSDHSLDEERFITVGVSLRGRVLFVVYTEHDSGVRLIGARVATAAEREQYEHER